MTGTSPRLARLRVAVAENHERALTVVALGAILAGGGLYLPISMPATRPSVIVEVKTPPPPSRCR